MSDCSNEVRRVTQAVYRSVWTEYYLWEQSSCSDILGNLGNGSRGPMDHEPDDSWCFDGYEDVLSPPPTEHTSSNHENLFPDQPEFVVQDSGEPSTSRKIITATVLRAPQPTIIPTDPYEACTPAYRTILHGDDANDLSFIPFADDPRFDGKAYAAEYKRFAWQERHSIPDVRWLCLETARRVHFAHDISLADIDASGVLPFKILSHPDESDAGLIWWAKMNDPPDWPPLREVSKLFEQDSPAPGEHDWTQRVQDLLTLFCSNPNCVQAHCWSHENETHHLNRDPRHILPLATTEPELPHSPCGNLCYLLTYTGTQEVESPVECSEIHLVYLLFSLSPEASTCDVAAVARMVCRQVHDLRKSWRQTLEVTGVLKTAPVMRVEPPSSVHRRQIETPQFHPCIHEGPCMPQNGCTCCQNDGYCERTCCCPPDCSRRWQGCNCAKNRRCRVNLCLPSQRCPCRTASRECAPGLCDCCQHTEAQSVNFTCQNSQLQREETKYLKVQRSEWGFGVVLCEDVRANDLICEYMGELIYEPTLYSRDHVARHRNRFYAYALNADFNVDASSVGTESRYINNARRHRANCVVQIKMVNGEHRIGVYAKRNITAGTEIFIDYGPEIKFNTDKADS